MAGTLVNSDAGNILALTSLAISLTVNAVVTGLIVLRIVKVYVEETAGRY